MKKLLLVLLVVALASFLLVGCFGVPDGTEGEEEPDGEVGICPTITIAGSYTDPISGKTYVNGDADEVVVTFAQPTEGVSIYLVGGVWWVMGGVELKDETKESIFDLTLPYTVSADGKTYTASIPSWVSELDCEPFMIKVVSCDGECECVESFIVDSVPPEAKIEICVDGCTCEGCELSFTSTIEDDCDETVNCDDDCSGLASWSIDIYDDYPFEDCCEVPCIEPIDSDSGVCPVDFTTSCLEDLEDGAPVFAVVTLVDNVGNDVKWGVWVGVCDYDTCEEIWIDPYTSGAGIDDECLDTAAGIFSVCEDHLCDIPE